MANENKVGFLDKTYLHIAGELLVIAGIGFYFSKKSNEVYQHISFLTEELEKQKEYTKTLETKLNILGNNMNTAFSGFNAKILELSNMVENLNEKKGFVVSTPSKQNHSQLSKRKLKPSQNETWYEKAEKAEKESLQSSRTHTPTKAQSSQKISLQSSSIQQNKPETINISTKKPEIKLEIKKEVKEQRNEDSDLESDLDAEIEDELKDLELKGTQLPITSSVTSVTSVTTNMADTADNVETTESDESDEDYDDVIDTSKINRPSLKKYN